MAPLSEEAWNKKQDLMELLYLVEDHELKEISEIMKSHYGFLAT